MMPPDMMQQMQQMMAQLQDGSVQRAMEASVKEIQAGGLTAAATLRKGEAAEDGGESDLSAGDRARIDGLAARADLNGEEGFLLHFLPAKGRWAVAVARSNERVLIRSRNLARLPPLASYKHRVFDSRGLSMCTHLCALPDGHVCAASGSPGRLQLVSKHRRDADGADGTLGDVHPEERELFGPRVFEEGRCLGLASKLTWPVGPATKLEEAVVFVCDPEQARVKQLWSDGELAAHTFDDGSAVWRDNFAPPGLPRPSSAAIPCACAYDEASALLYVLYSMPIPDNRLSDRHRLRAYGAAEGSAVHLAWDRPALDVALPQGLLRKPMGLALHGAELFVADSDAHRIVVLSTRTGEHLRSLGEEGKRPGQLTGPMGLAALDARLYVAESKRLHVLSLSGAPLLLLPLPRAMQVCAVCVATPHDGSAAATDPCAPRRLYVSDSACPQLHVIELAAPEKREESLFAAAARQLSDEQMEGVPDVLKPAVKQARLAEG